MAMFHSQVTGPCYQPFKENLSKTPGEKKSFKLRILTENAYLEKIPISALQMWHLCTTKNEIYKDL